jgi:putative transposase
MINRAHKLPISRQAELLGISRASVYYLPRPVSENDLTIMRRLDELHLRYPFMGARMLRDQLNRQGIDIGRKHVSTLMKKININAVYRKPNTSKKQPGHKIYPYLLRTLTINRPNQVWALDTSYIPMAKGFVYLTAVIDWNSRKVLASKVAITLEACHAVDVLEEAFKLYGTPEIINTDQGSQFTATIFVDCVEAKGCRLSMDGRGAWRDNVFIERVWRSVKYECVYLYAYDSVKDAKHSIQKYLDWYNQERPHSNLNRLTPDEAYYGLLSPLKKAA